MTHNPFAETTQLTLKYQCYIGISAKDSVSQLVSVFALFVNHNNNAAMP